MIIIFKFVKRIIMSFVLLYTYNLLAVSVNLTIPMNVITILVTSFLGIPGFFMLVFYKTFM